MLLLAPAQEINQQVGEADRRSRQAQEAHDAAQLASSELQMQHAQVSKDLHRKGGEPAAPLPPPPKHPHGHMHACTHVHKCAHFCCCS